MLPTYSITVGGNYIIVIIHLRFILYDKTTTHYKSIKICN